MLKKQKKNRKIDRGTSRHILKYQTNRKDNLLNSLFEAYREDLKSYINLILDSYKSDLIIYIKGVGISPFGLFNQECLVENSHNLTLYTVEH